MSEFSDYSFDRYAGLTGGAKKKKAAGKKKKRVETFKSYIKQVFKKHHDGGMTAEAATALNDLVKDQFERTIADAVAMRDRSGLRTLRVDHILAAVIMVNGNNKKLTDQKKKLQTDLHHFDLVFPVGRLKRYIKEKGYRQEAGAAETIARYLQNHIEGIAVFIDVKNIADKNQRVTAQHVSHAMHKYMKPIAAPVAGGGVLPHIHPALLPKSSKAGKKALAGGAKPRKRKTCKKRTSRQCRAKQYGKTTICQPVGKKCRKGKKRQST
jgi:histone H2A